LEDVSQTASVSAVTLPKSPRDYEGTFELQVGAEGHYEEYGRGAWSIVYRAEHTPKHRTRIAKGDSAKMIVAVKAPLYQGSASILEHEALVLTHLTQTTTQSEAAHYIVTFLGYDLPTKSLVLEPVPLTLATYSKTYALEAKKTFSHKTIRDPIVGTQCWLQIVRGLVEGLGFLQARSVVHGDIKPTNILMRPRGGAGGSPLNGNNKNIYPREYQGTAKATVLSHTPLLCDFSSSRLLTDPTPPSALTSSFAAPELLNPRIPGIATFASDIYSLALSLLSPALGADVYAGAANAMQALHWAKEGMPLDFARSGDAGLRVSRGGLVDRVLGGAAKRIAEERWEIDEWEAVIRSAMDGSEDLGKEKKKKTPNFPFFFLACNARL
jgi:serine/threonine protein kinase